MSKARRGGSIKRTPYIMESRRREDRCRGVAWHVSGADGRGETGRGRWPYS